MKPLIFLTRSLPDEVMDDLKKRVRIIYHREDRPLTRKELLRGIGNAEGLISMLSDSIDQEVLNCAPRLRIIANYAVGYNNIDIKEAALRSIRVTNTPGVLTDATADLVWGLLLAVARRFPEGDAMIRSGKWTGWAPTQLVGGDVFGRTLGIVGMGRIGRAVARRSIGFSMKVVYFSRRRLPPDEERKLNVRYRPLLDLLKESDYVSLHVPLTKETFHLIDGRALRTMKTTAYLINTARGPIVDENALLSALKRGEISGAGLDVFEAEPKISKGLIKMKKVVLLPHLGSASRNTRIKMGRVVLKNLSAHFSGKRPPDCVN